MTALFCKEALAGKDVAAAVIEAIRQSSLWVDSHPDAAADLAVRYNGISSDREAVKSSIPRSAFRVSPLSMQPIIPDFNNFPCNIFEIQNYWYLCSSYEGSVA